MEPVFRDSEQEAGLIPLPNRRQSTRREEDRRLQRRDRELEAARRISEALFQRLTTDELVAQALHTALDVIGAESGSILLADHQSEQLVFRHSIGASPVQTGTTIPWNQGIAGDVFHSGKPVVIREAKADPRHFTGIDDLTRHVTHDLIALPLKRWEGEPIGVLEVLNKREGQLDEDDLAILTIVSGIAAASIEQARLFQDAKLAEVARVLGDIGHDIKNLLMPVICGTGLLESEIKDLLNSSRDISTIKAKASFELCAEVIGMVRSSTRRIQDRVQEIADCVKGRSAPPEFAPCQVARVVDSVFETLRWLATEKGVALRSSGLDQLPPMIADERRLFNAFYNLVNNAIPEVQPGGSVTITGCAEDGGKHILISVADTGRGIPPEVLRTLFTARTISHKAGGTGLGTKIVKDVVDAHGGQVTVESQVGGGTTFHLRFPLRLPGV
jgi:signal transduction histidine kinase